MFRDKERYGHDPATVLRSKTKFYDPIKWSRDMQASGMPHELPKTEAFPGMKIFTCSWSDFFIEDADEWRPEAWNIIKDTPEFIYQILTKRPDRIAQCLPEDWGGGYPNVWLGVSVENQKALVERFIPLCSVRAKVRFLSIEPLIGPVDLCAHFVHASGVLENPIHWVIIGGESGNETGKYRYRECKSSWIRDLVIQCHSYKVPVFVKQLGTHIAKITKLKDRHGGDISEWPEYLQVREFPNS